MPKPSVVMPQWMLDEIDDRRHSRTDRSEWIRGAIKARLDAEDRGEWDEYASEENDREEFSSDGGDPDETNPTEVSTRADV